MSNTEITLPVECVITIDPEKPLFSRELLQTLVDTAQETLEGWLKENQAPQETIDLVEYMAIVWMELVYLGSGHIRSDHQGLYEAVSALSRLIPDLGGAFHTASGEIVKHD